MKHSNSVHRLANFVHSFRGKHELPNIEVGSSIRRILSGRTEWSFDPKNPSSVLLPLESTAQDTQKARGLSFRGGLPETCSTENEDIRREPAVRGVLQCL